MDEIDSYTEQPITIGACVKCKYEDELDSHGLCGSCDPLDKATVQFLATLTRPRQEV